MARAAKVFGYILLFAGGGLIVMGLAGIYMKQGFAGVQEVMSPFNIWQWIATLVTLAPGLFFLWLSDWLSNRTT